MILKHVYYYILQDYSNELVRARKRVRELEDLLDGHNNVNCDQEDGVPPIKRRKLNDG